MQFSNKGLIAATLLGGGAITALAVLGGQITNASTDAHRFDAAALLGVGPERDDLSAKDRARVGSVLDLTEDFSKAERFERMQGGAATSLKKINRDAFSQSSANLSFEQEMDFKLGNALFRKLWVSSPASTHASDGLGPLFNARACQSCHLKDGRGHPPEADSDSTSFLLRLARGPKTGDEYEALRTYAAQNFPDRVYGGQLQDLAVPGLAREGEIEISYEEQIVRLRGGEEVFLRKPTYTISNLGYGPLGEGTTISPRVANPMIGLGLVDAIHPADFIALADEHDADGDGVSGKLNIVTDPETKELAIGLYGWKASEATLASQTASAFAGDIGISSKLVANAHGDCTPAQSDCLSMPTGVQPRLGDSEAPEPAFGLVTFYAANLAVPARRDVDDPTVLRGKELFYNTGCVACHQPKFVTSRDAEREEHRFQLIWPYSDFLLHDMGEGLADGQTVGRANGREWRTPPLWGIGLTETVNGHTFFLHDGRARSLKEAILWHGGEAQMSRDRFADLRATDRDAMIRFLESL
ncbi:MAG: di-heme oxidoredictase family protein [Pseudomonadota bacterium]